MNYIYADEDNNPMFDVDGHNPTVYTDRATMIAWEKGEPDQKEKPSDGCWNCIEYNPSKGACMLHWNNLDESYYNPDTDDREPDEHCEEHKPDQDAVYDDFFGFGGNEP